MRRHEKRRGWQAPAPSFGSRVRPHQCAAAACAGSVAAAATTTGAATAAAITATTTAGAATTAAAVGAATTATATAAAVRAATAAATAGPTAATVATTATAATTAATKAARTLFTRAGLVDDNGTAFQRLPVHAVDGRLGLGIRAHLDEAEALRTARVPVHHDLCGGHCAELREGLVQRLVAHGIGKIADVKFVSHWGALVQKRRTMWSFNPARTIQDKVPHPDTGSGLSRFVAAARKGGKRRVLFCRLQAYPRPGARIAASANP